MSENAEGSERRESDEEREEQDEREELIQRILVALDTSPHSLAALQAAADLAARLDAELMGLYVEDIQVLRLSDIPLTREVSLYSASPRALDRQKVELQLRAQARAARRAIERLAEWRRIRWSFSVVQGSVPDEVLNAAEDTDLVILGKVGWSRGRQLGSTARLVIERASRPAMILGHGEQLKLPLGIVYDGSAGVKRALRVAAHLIQESGSFLIVMILAGDVETARSLQADIADWLRERGLNARFRWLIRPDLQSLKAVFQSEGCGMLVLPGDSESFPSDVLAGFLRSTGCPVMLVRG
jgi:nucleotide-binding universal stress UspA family protein